MPVRFLVFPDTTIQYFLALDVDNFWKVEKNLCQKCIAINRDFRELYQSRLVLGPTVASLPQAGGTISASLVS